MTSTERVRQWRIKNPRKRNLQRLRNYHQSNVWAINKRQRYTQQEMEWILAHSMTDRELSKKIGRTIHAIHAIRSKWLKENFVKLPVRQVCGVCGESHHGTPFCLMAI